LSFDTHLLANSSGTPIEHSAESTTVTCQPSPHPTPIPTAAAIVGQTKVDTNSTNDSVINDSGEPKSNNNKTIGENNTTNEPRVEKR